MSSVTWRAIGIIKPKITLISIASILVKLFFQLVKSTQVEMVFATFFQLRKLVCIYIFCMAPYQHRTFGFVFRLTLILRCTYFFSVKTFFWLQSDTLKNYIVPQLSIDFFRVKNTEDSWLLSTPMSLSANTPTLETKETKTQRELLIKWQIPWTNLGKLLDGNSWWLQTLYALSNPSIYRKRRKQQTKTRYVWERYINKTSDGYIKQRKG